MPILQYLDIAIGYAFAMLLLATLTGALVEVIQAICRSRKLALQDGLARLVESLGIESTSAAAIAREVLLDTPVKSTYLASEAIQREEFILVLLRRAIMRPASDLATAIQSLSGKAPAALLTEIERLTVEMEAAEPLAPSYIWRVKAIEKAGAGPFAGRVFSWYDNMTRRVDDYVGFQGRMIGAVAALVVCFGLVQVDSLDLLNRLGRDEAFRKAMVERAVEEVKKLPPAEGSKGVTPVLPESGTAPAAAAPTAVTPDPAKPVPVTVAPAAMPAATPTMAKTAPKPAENVQLLLDELLKKADHTRSILAPSTQPELIGLAITWIMVSLGSAFWWGLLKKLVGLKSGLGEKLDAQRTLRDSDQRPHVNTAMADAAILAGIRSTPATSSNPSSAFSALGHNAANGNTGSQDRLSMN